MAVGSWDIATISMRGEALSERGRGVCKVEEKGVFSIGQCKILLVDNQ
jgi:hypothetical protein